jgi:hypothetical protein
VVCLRRRFPGLAAPQIDSANAELVERFEAAGRGLLSSTRLRDRYAIRMCVMNHTTGRSDVEQTVRWLATVPVGIG